MKSLKSLILILCLCLPYLEAAAAIDFEKQIQPIFKANCITMHAAADPAVSVGHAAEFRNGTIELRFMLEDEKDVLGLNIADPACKEVHAGHLFKIDVS